MPRSKRLHRVNDSDPGLRRERRNEDFVYLDESGREVADEETLARIRSLAIPPAYTEVWICGDPLGHIQATGRDARGRKQYRYHPQWRCQRDDTKYGRMAAFGRALPIIRAQVARDIRLPGLPRAKILATLVRLLEQTLIRVGHDDYARNNHSYGLTTLRNRHVSIDGATVAFSFRGKSGVRHRISLRDRTLAGIVRRARELPGQEVFQYVERDRVRSVTAEDVNAYLKACTGDDFTAKDFRTWSASVLCLDLLCQLEPAESAVQARRRINQVVAMVAERLGNTPTVCRKSYIHPAVITAYLEGGLADWQAPLAGREPGLKEEEGRFLAFLEEGCL